MTNTITFATSSKGKVSWLERGLRNAGLANAWRIEMQSLPIAELQSWELAEISLHKARQAYELVKAPVVVMDGGLYIKELNGFPGPFGSYMIDKMGIDNIARLAGTLTDKTCAFKNVLTYMTGPDEYKQFFDDTGTLYTLTDQAWPTDHPLQWSPIWRVMTPSGMGFSKPLAAFDDDDLKKYHEIAAPFQENYSVLPEFINHLKSLSPAKTFGT